MKRDYPMPHAKSAWKTLRRGVFIALMSLAWGLWLICILVQLALLPLPIGEARAVLGLLLPVSMGSLLLWCFVIYWWDPKLSRTGWLSLLAMVVLWLFTPMVTAL
jgi:hypothetical protein